MTLLSAPAGFGKTVLLTQWLQQLTKKQQPTEKPEAGKSPYRIAWLSLDETDNDPVRFLTYLIATLQTVWPECGQTILSVLRASRHPNIEGPLVALVNELTTFEGRLVLVLDDYQVIKTQSVHDSLNFILENLPTALHLVISTRTDPPFQLARLRGHGLLTELNANDLRFSPEETRDFVVNVADLLLSADDIDRLDQRIEGWPVGWQLVALSLRNRSTEDVRHLVTTITRHNRYIADYLMEEVLQHQPPLVKNFLLQTSILSRLSGPVCEALQVNPGALGGADSDAFLDNEVFANSPNILDYLVRTNAFLVPLDNAGEWYRYHRLFADLLQSRLQGMFPHLVAGLHRRASEWFEHNGWLAEAVNHALHGDDLARAARLIGENAQDLLKRGEVATLQRWLQDERLTRTDPQLATVYAWSLMLLEPFETLSVLEQTLDIVKQTVEQLPDDARSGLLAEVQAIRTILAIEQGRTSGDDIGRARQLFDRLSEDKAFLRAGLANSLGVARHATGDTTEAIQMFSLAQTVSEHDDNILGLLFANYELAGLLVEHGQLGEAAKLYRQSLALGESRFGPGVHHLPLLGAGYTGLGLLYYEWNLLDQASQNLEIAVDVTGQKGHMGLNRHAALAMCFLQQAFGNEVQADHWIQRAENLAWTAPREDIAATVNFYKVRLWLRQNRLVAVENWLAGFDLDPAQVPAYSGEFGYLTLARANLGLGNRKQLVSIAKVLDQMLSRAESQQRLGTAIEIAILLAQINYFRQASEQTGDTLAHALALAAPEGYVRIFVDSGPLMVELLERAVAQKISPNYASQLLAACKAEQVRYASHAERQPLVDPLTAREMEVLNLLAAGLSNKDVAETLYITPGTVKRHTVNIYSKLSVNSRTQAVARARELNLID
jgi:LuxR family maltose regulon positive regulatory protein